jgi:hypothetical protein
MAQQHSDYSATLAGGKERRHGGWEHHWASYRPPAERTAAGDAVGTGVMAGRHRRGVGATLRRPWLAAGRRRIASATDARPPSRRPGKDVDPEPASAARQRAAGLGGASLPRECCGGLTAGPARPGPGRLPASESGPRRTVQHRSGPGRTDCVAGARDRLPRAAPSSSLPPIPPFSFHPHPTPNSASPPPPFGLKLGAGPQPILGTDRPTAQARRLGRAV